MTLDPNSPLHFLNGLTPDPDAVKDARAFALMLPTARHMGGRVEDLCMCFAHFATDERHSGPRLAGAHAKALHVFAFAASGLFAFLEDGQRPGLEDGWATLSRARLWAVDKCQQATADLPRAAVEALHLAFPHTLPAWASGQGRTVEAGRLAAWWAVSHLLEAAPHLEDGEAEELTAAVLEALTPGPHHPAAHPFASPDSVPAAPTVYTAQYAGALPSGRVRVSMGGGEDYELTRAQVALTPLRDGSGFLALFIGTPDALTVCLTPEDCQTVRRALALDGPTPPPPLSDLNCKELQALKKQRPTFLPLPEAVERYCCRGGTSLALITPSK